LFPVIVVKVFGAIARFVTFENVKVSMSTAMVGGEEYSYRVMEAQLYRCIEL